MILFYCFSWFETREINSIDSMIVLDVVHLETPNILVQKKENLNFENCVILLVLHDWA